VKRKSALSNILNNYFGTDPFAMEKQKPRLHLPPANTNSNSNSNNNNNSSSFAKRFLVKPLNLRLGPPIKLLPTLNRSRPPPPPPQQQQHQQQQHQEQQPMQKQQQRVQPQPSEDVYRASVPAPLLASGFKEQQEQGGGRVPAPLLARNGPTKQESSGGGSSEEEKAARRNIQTFSQLVSQVDSTQHILIYILSVV
jgi:hypothetical protein